MLAYIIFAYKIVDASQIPSLANQLPQWAKTEEFDIQARAENHNPTKDQMRLMMQSLLADRFKLALHTETRQLPVYALVLDKPGMPGPQLRPHPDDVPCTGADKPAPASIVSEPPSFCGAVQAWAVNNQRHFRMVDVTMGQIAAFLAVMGGGQGGLDQRPVLDQTGLPGGLISISSSFPHQKVLVHLVQTTYPKRPDRHLPRRSRISLVLNW